MMRFLFALASFAVLAAATHANVMHAGGYQIADAPLIIAVGALLAIGTGGAAYFWQLGHKVMPIVLGLCLVAGEAYWLFLNADREFASREAAAQPLQEAIAQKANLEARLRDARAAKYKIDDTAASKSAEIGCKKECRLLLQGQIADAQRDLEKAQRELDALPAVHVLPRLSEQLGLPAWQWDALLAALRALAVMGSSIGIALALHPKKVGKSYLLPEALHPKRQMHTITPNVKIETQPAKLEPVKLEAPKSNVVKLTPARQLATFASDHIKRDAAGRVSMRDVLLAYERYCQEAALTPLERAEFVRKFADLCERAGVTVEVEGRNAYLIGARLITERSA